MVAPGLNSCLYVGSVRHRRFSPKAHAFRYGLFMTYLDLSELDRVFAGRWLWSTRRWALGRFRRQDYFDGAGTPLGDAVRVWVASRTGRAPAGPICMLTHLKMFGFCFNPITLYFCYSPDRSHVEALIAEVTNTPWGERQLYLIDTQPAANSSGLSRGKIHASFAKRMHVSPFMDMDYMYVLHMTEPGSTLTVHLENLRAKAAPQEPTRKVHDATLILRRRGMSGANLSWALLAYPFLTARLVLAIYWQALRL